MTLYHTKQIFVTKLSAIETTDLEGLGTLRFQDEGVYMWVKMDAVGAARGELLCKTGLTEIWGKVPASTTSTLGKKRGSVFGVAAADAAVAANKYFWVQMSGASVKVRKMAVLANRDGTRSWPIVGATLGRLNVVTSNQASLPNIRILATVSTSQSTLVNCRISFFV